MSDNSSQILFIDNGGKAKIGEEITLRCGACGYPTPTYDWLDTNGNVLTSADRYSVRRITMVKHKEILCAGVKFVLCSLNSLLSVQLSHVSYHLLQIIH